ncbi:RNA polymerase subunit sigma-24 [Pedobacter yulinensis]|uniref:RNA polymerase subunit sigma-24 n=1 Tax=Pedobacter yulinensis TaxID=2126353 RepID=A0A2T3HRR3_9SPHI|nr:RNA polymerase sigma factor [Pedobacter yulinensis]PST85155.1 RNA polymerase subunit sigma-24 [Pedobacter yulinensis]
MEAVYIDKNSSLVDACRKGSRKAQFDLYKLYARAMYNVSVRILNDEAEAEDVLQEAFLDAFTRIGDFRQETTFGLWLKQIVINRSINYLRKRKVELVSVDEVDLPAEEAADGEYEQLQADAVRKAMMLLPDGYRVVLSLYLLEGYDHEEIAHILQISEVTSRSQYMRGKKKLVEILEKSGIAR